jgi:hypothetical protein
MTNADGKWNIVIATPIGRQEVTLDITTSGSTATGTAQTNAELVDLHEGAIDGDDLVCSVDLKKPFPMKVTYTLTFEGDEVTGTAKAGPFPASKVIGSRA